MSVRQRIAGRRGQQGYALIAVLVAIGVFSLIVLALLDLVGMDSATTGASKDAARMRRATDGALEVGIGQLKATSSASLANPSSPCTGFPAGSQLTIEERTLDITCSDATDMTVPAPRALPAADSGDATAVLLLRDGWDSSAIVPDAYTTAPEQTFSFAPFCVNMRIGPLVTCINEKAGISLETLDQILYRCRYGSLADQVFCPIKVVWRVLSGGAGVMHVGDEPLKVYGNVDVSKWGLVTAIKPSSSSGLQVENGRYRQGVSDGSCSATVLAELGNLQPSRTGAVSPAAACGAIAAPAMPTPPTPTTQVGQVPAETQCVSGGVVPIEPGAFDAGKVRDLNSRFKAAACNNVTFWFKPGAYFFDGASLYDNAALNFTNATSNVVFGEPRGWTTTARAPDSVFPEACNRNGAGASIVLGPTTSIVHNAGAVAICGSISQTVGPAVLAPVTLTATPDVSPANTSTCNNGWHVCTATWPLGPLSSPDPTLGERPITSAKMLIKAKIDNAQPQNVVWWTGYGDSKTTVRFSRGTKSCAVLVDNHSYASWPVNNLSSPFSVDLIADTSPCKNVITTQADIEEGTFSVDFDLNRAGCSQQWSGWVCSVINYTLDTASVVTTTGEIQRRTPMPMTIQVDPAAHRTFNVFGSVSLPYTQIDVKWWQPSATAATTYTLPVFVGSVDARSLFSHPGNDQVPTHIGTLASRNLQPLARRVQIKASMRAPDGSSHLVGTALVTIVDEPIPSPPSPPSGAAQAFAPGSGLTTSDWDYCDVPLTPTATC